MERFFSIIAIAAMTLGVAWSAYGSDQPEAATPPSFDELDADGNGVISMDEASGHPSVQRVFARVDGDRDGQLAREEYAAARQELAPKEPGR